MKELKILSIITLVLFAVLFQVSAQESVTVTGTITDGQGEPLIGASVMVKNKVGLGTMTDLDGRYSIKVDKYSTLVYSYVGFETKELPVTDQTVMNVILSDNVGELAEVTVTAGGRVQRKATVTGAITTVDVKRLNANTSQLSNTLAGNVPGIIAMQTSGEPGKNFSEFWIRGMSTFGASASALILVDGIERNFNEINVEDIESFSVLKDASATAIYGQRGANGVVIVKTKRGTANKVNITAKAEAGINFRSRTPKYVDGPTYAQLANEARQSRYQDPLYTPQEIEIFKHGLDPDLYPNVDWYKELFKEAMQTYRASVSLSGGGETARYFVSGSYVTEEGMYKTDNVMNDYNTNARYSRYNFRSNVDVNITKTTEIQLGVAGWLSTQNRPGNTGNGGDVFKAIAALPAVSSPLVLSNGLYPTSFDGMWVNPWVTMTQMGYSETWENKMETNISLLQDLAFITEGLRFTARFAFDVWNKNVIDRWKRPDLYLPSRMRDSKGDLITTRLVESMSLTQSEAVEGNRRYYGELMLDYERLFAEKHRVSGLLLYFQQETASIANFHNDDRFKRLINGIPKRNIALSGRVTYGYMDRYLLEFNFGYTGSENFQKGERFGFFPAISGGWVISEEQFIKERLPWLDMFKVRYSYGEVGTDVIGDGVRFTYFDTIGGGGGYSFHEYGTIGSSGITVDSYASQNLTWEVAKKHNLGVDIVTHNNKFSLTADIFKDNRERIFMQRQQTPYSTGIEQRKPWANIGRMESKGIDGNVSYTQDFGEVSVTFRGNATYSKSKVLDRDEELNIPEYQKQAGYRLDQTRGLIALGLFKDQAEIDNAPRQTFGGTVRPGDIRYKDVNGDGIIDQNDVVPIGYSTRPSLTYGFGLSANWRNFDFNILFQGSGQCDFFLGGAYSADDPNPGGVYPFMFGNRGNILDVVAKPGNRWISREISENPATENPNAIFPRLSYDGNQNNYRNSTFWLRNSKYLRLKNLEVGYSVPKHLTSRFNITNLRVFFLGNNLAVFSPFKWWDPEIGSTDGARYPISRNCTLGLNISF